MPDAFTCQYALNTISLINAFTTDGPFLYFTRSNASLFVLVNVKRPAVKELISY